MLPMLAAGAALQIAGGLFGSNSAKKAAQRAEQQARERQMQIQGYGRDALARSQGFAATMPDSSSFKPWNIVTNRGGWNIDPATGSATAQFSQPVQGYQDWAFGQSKLAQDQLGGFDRQGFAQQEFNRGQGLLAEGRGQQMSDTLGMLQRKGLAGFGQTMPGGSSTVAGNPIMSSLFDRRNRQDLELMDRSFGSADGQMDRLYGRATGLFDRGNALSDSLNGQLTTGMQFGQQDYERGMQDFRNRAGLFQNQEELQRLAALGGMEEVGQSQQRVTQARLGRDQGFAGMFQNIGGSMMSNPQGWGGMFTPRQPTQPDYINYNYGPAGW